MLTCIVNTPYYIYHSRTNNILEKTPTLALPNLISKSCKEIARKATYF